MKQKRLVVKLQKVVSGGQTIADANLTTDQTVKVFVWGGLPGEEVEVCLTKKRAGIYEGYVEQVLAGSTRRVKPLDRDSFLSTSPWQVYDWQFELEQKAQLIQQAFLSQKISLELPEIITDNQQYHYRNKMEFTWWWDKQANRVELAVYRRGTKGKIIVHGSSLALPEINQAALKIRDLLNQKRFEAQQLKTLLIRTTQAGQTVAQLYVTDPKVDFSETDFEQLNITGFELIFSDPKSPASVITNRLRTFGQTRLSDLLNGLSFSYPAESFFQINLPIYQLALKSIRSHLSSAQPIVDLYSGVGTIGLSMAHQLHSPVRLVEINPSAVEEMRSNINYLGINNAQAILAAAEDVVSHISSDCQLVVDPPRAGLHQKVIQQILTALPPRVIYLSCNVVTQARDVALLLKSYRIVAVTGFNFFPKTPHIENLVILEHRH